MATKFDYFDAFIKQTEVGVEEAQWLVDAVEGFTTTEALVELTRRAHEVESQGDTITHGIYNSVSTDFITPIERDDLIAIAQCLDDVVDNIEEVIQSFYMYNVQFMHEDAKGFAQIIMKSCKALNAGMTEFRHFKKNKDLSNYFILVNDCEEEGDRLFFAAMHKLYTEHSDDPMMVLTWSRVFNLMEKCCDACEHVADVAATAVLKNS